MDYFLQGFGVFLGVLAGVAVTIFADFYFSRRKETQQTQNLKFELELNIKKIEKWLELVSGWRDAVNSDTLDTTYYGYFDLSRVLSVTANAMLQSGLLYEKLNHDQIGKLQVFFSEFSPHYEQYLSNQIAQDRTFLEKCRADNVMNTWISEYKPQAVRNILFWEKKFQDHKKALHEIVRALG